MSELTTERIDTSTTGAQPANETPAGTSHQPVAPPQDASPVDTPAPVSQVSPPTPSEKPVPSADTTLSPEEQMERFAQALKENDWGHQPC